jgi:hypothetical protein
MRTAAEILHSAGITTESTAPGRYHTTCPQCSHKRKPAHQKSKCLGITIDERGVKYGCNHCGWKGGGFYEPRKGGKKNGGGSPFVAQYIYRQANGEPYLRVCRTANKQFPQFHWDDSTWVKGKPKGPKIPYLLGRLLADPVGTTIYFCEGERDADNLTKLGFVATTASEGAKAKWDLALTDYFKNRPVVILPDADAPGRAHGQKVARALQPVAASVKVVDLYPDRSDGSDVSDWLESDTVGVQLIQAVNGAPPWEPNADTGEKAPSSDDEALIAELATLNKLQYGKRRKEAAKQIGIRVEELDAIIAEKRGGDKKLSPALYEHWNVEPWDQPVDGGILLRALTECLRRYVFMTKDQVITVALWIIFTWLHEYEEVVTHSPILLVTSPEKDSGKTTLLRVVSFLARRPVASVSISGPALFRSIEKWAPCFVLDEADKAYVANEDLRSVINSGWTRGDSVIRCEPDTHEPRPYSTFAPKAIGMKGRNLPDTTLSRCVAITMRPKRKDDPNEQTEDFNHLDNETFARLRQQLLRWATDNADALARAAPGSPPGFHNRRRANWRTLLAIAEALGGECKLAAWKAAVAIEQVHDTFNPAIGIQLLRAIQIMFEQPDIECLLSRDVIRKLTDDPEQPWVEYRNGKSITQKQLAGLLREYGIISGTVHPPGLADGKGYKRHQFEEAWDIYLTPSDEFSAFGPSKRPNADEMGTSRDFRSVRERSPDGSKNTNLSHSHAGWDAWTDRKPENGARACSDHEKGAGDFPDFLRRCAQCNAPGDDRGQVVEHDNHVWLHRECQRFWLKDHAQ